MSTIDKDDARSSVSTLNMLVYFCQGLAALVVIAKYSEVRSIYSISPFEILSQQMMMYM